MANTDLVVPVYLNQRLVFDLLAMLQGGISTVTAVTKTESNSNTNSEKAKAAFGLAEALSSLLKIGLSGEKETSKGEKSDRQVSEERVHTPASLFYQLRHMLVEKNIFTTLNEGQTINPGMFVEFEGPPSKNPLVETLDSVVEMLSLMTAFDDPKPQSGKKTQENDYRKIKTQMESLGNNLKAGNTVDVTSGHLPSSFRAVVTLETAYLNDPMMSDLVDGKFKVIGKVIQHVDKDGSISLIRKTVLSKMPSPVLMQIVTALTKLGSEQDFALPQPEWEIKDPALHMLPIAIYA